MDLGKIIGGGLVFFGIVLGVATFSMTGAAVGYRNLPELIGIFAGSIFVIGIIFFLSGIEKPDKSSNDKIREIQIFSERN